MLQRGGIAVTQAVNEKLRQPLAEENQATMSKEKNKTARLIVAASETDPDMLYATKFWAPDPFIFLQRNGKRTLVLSDLEIDRGRKQADADEFVMFSEVETEVQGKSKKAPPYEKVLVAFSPETRRKIRNCSRKFPTSLCGGTCSEQNPCSLNERNLLAGAGSEIGQGSRNDGTCLADHGKRTQTRDRSVESIQTWLRKTIALERQNADFRNAPGGN